jgi:putative PIN family toxin of toxin-antitoxin system
VPAQERKLRETKNGEPCLIVVLDTNIWVSALQFGQRYSTPVQALEKAMREDVIAISDEMEAEVYRVLTEKFAWESRPTQMALSSVLARSIRVNLKGTVHICRDPKDNMFLECSARAKADILIAGDKDLLVLGRYARTRIVTPLEYVNLPG